MNALSPSARGLIPGLFLALAAAVAVLALNRTWLLPAVDDDGVGFLVSAERIAAEEGAAPSSASTPITATSIRDRGPAVSLAMSLVVRAGRRPFVAALWVLALSAAVLAGAASWAAGGAGGMLGGILGGLTTLLSTGALLSGTSVEAALPLAAVAVVLLGSLAYRPRWSGVHGALGALAWWVHQAGIGAAAVAVLWPLRGLVGRRFANRTPLAGSANVTHGPEAADTTNALRTSVLYALLALALILLLAAASTAIAAASAAAPTAFSLPRLPAPELPAAAAALAGLLRWAGAGLPGIVGLLAGAGALVALALLAADELRRTPAPPPDVHWSDPRAADLVWGSLAPAAALLSGGLAVGAAVTAASAGPIADVWFAPAVPLAVLAGAAAARRGRAVRSVLLAWLLVSTVTAAFAFRTLRAEGRGHTRAVWVASEVIRWVDNRSAPWAVLYASDPGLVFFQSGRAARALPHLEPAVAGNDVAEPDAPTRAPGPAASIPDAFRAAFRAHPGPLILTDGAAGGAEVWARALGLAEAVRVPEGVVLVPSVEMNRP